MELDCARCGGSFPLQTPHTELVRRDFVEAPRPSTVEHLCRDCWRRYVEEFLGEEWQLDGVAGR